MAAPAYFFFFTGSFPSGSVPMGLSTEAGVSGEK